MTTSFYGRDLAEIHAAGFGQLAAAAAREAAARLSGGGRVLDLGCGAGELSAALARAGFSVWGADISAPFVALARQRVPEGEFVQGSVFELDLPPARAACAVGEVVNYLADPLADHEAALARLFHRIATALAPGGLLLFDAAEPGRAAGGSRGFTEGDGWAVGAVSEEADGVLTRRITTFRRTGEA